MQTDVAITFIIISLNIHFSSITLYLRFYICLKQQRKIMTDTSQFTKKSKEEIVQFASKLGTCTITVCCYQREGFLLPQCDLKIPDLCFTRKINNRLDATPSRESQKTVKEAEKILPRWQEMFSMFDFDIRNMPVDRDVIIQFYFLFFYQENVYVVLLNESGYSQGERTGIHEK